MAKTPEPVDSYFKILEMVKSEFDLKESYLRDGVPTFIIIPGLRIREKTERLRARLQRHGLDLVIRKSNGELVLRAVELRPSVRPPIFSRLRLPTILLIATLATVTISGYLSAESYITVLEIIGKPIPSKAGLTVLYTVSVMGVLGLHELGHMIACRIHHIKASLPLFIPGIPGLTPGTFGALVRQESPVLNRDQLFDVGFSGPLLSFVAALVVSYFGYSWSVPVSKMEYALVVQVLGPGQTYILPAIFLLLGQRILPNPDSYTHFLHPVAWAGWICTLITFLNAFPIGQLDGGHVSRALLGWKWHQRLSYITIGIMVLVGWWEMALLALLLIRPFHPGTLDNVTEVAKKRKIAGIFFVLIFMACFTFSSRSPLLTLIW